MKKDEAFEEWARSDPKAGFLFSERAAARAAWDESRRQAFEACAAEVEAAGCACFSLEAGDRSEDRESPVRFEDFRSTPGVDVVVEHDPRCPRALAARLRRLT